MLHTSRNVLYTFYAEQCPFALLSRAQVTDSQLKLELHDRREFRALKKKSVQNSLN